MLLLGAAAAPARARIKVLDLGNAPGIHITGGQTVSEAGDVNGDGTPDLLVAEGFRDDSSAGRVNVVFGTREGGEVNVDEPGDWGFVIDGAMAGDSAAIAAAAGDVNGDGRDDVLVGAPDAGRAYVVFGKTTSDDVELVLFDANAQGTMGYRVDGAGGLFGRTLSGVGDMNGDGLGDFVVGAPFQGATYVLFGKSDPLPYDVDLLHLGADEGGFLVSTPSPDVDSGYGVAGLGDVNGDGVPDVGVGVFNQDVPPGRRGGRACCKAWVVFGKADAAPVDVGALAGGGFKIRRGGSAVTAVGDVNGDGFADIGLGTTVVFGSRSTKMVDRYDLGSRGYQVTGTFVVSMAGAGDVTGDGRSDILLGDLGARFGGRDSGSTYLVPGKRSTTSVDVLEMGRGLRIDGEGPGAYSGMSVAGPGDVNGDGIPDLAIAAPGPAAALPGDVYIVWGVR